MTHEKYTKLKFQCLSINFLGDTAILNLINLFFLFFSLCGCFYTTNAEWSSGDRDGINRKTLNIFISSFTEKFC